MSVPTLIATVVDTDALIQTVAAALGAGIGITVIFSLAIFGAGRSMHHAAAGRKSAATVMGVLALGAIGATLAAVVLGVIVMTTK